MSAREQAQAAAREAVRCRCGYSATGAHTTECVRWSEAAILAAVIDAAEPHIRRHERAMVQHAIDRVTRTAAAAQEKAVTAAVASERERLFVALRYAIGLEVPWRGEALDVIAGVWQRPEDGERA